MTTMLLAEMTSAHFIYIPGVFGLGVVAGYLLGGKAATMARADATERERLREARRARRARGEPRVEP